MCSMKFECNGQVRYTGVFADFDRFQDFRSWACIHFELGVPSAPLMHVYDMHDRAWKAVHVTDRFELAPYYKIVVRGYKGEVASVVTLLPPKTSKTCTCW